VGPVCARRLAVVLVLPGRSGAAYDPDGAVAPGGARRVRQAVAV